jgi:nucleotide-binding universal stress UspA family protein
MAFKRILVPTDFSECAGFALDHAIGLACDTGGRIDLVHSIYVPNVYDVPTPIDIERQMTDIAKERLALLFERVEQRGVPCETHVIQETAPGGIHNLAEKLDSDCVVMGTRGLTGLAHVVLGSTAERTLRLAPCPVLTVSAAPDADAGRPRKVLVPTDFSETAECATTLARELLHGQPDGEVVLLHTFQQPMATGPYAFAVGNAFSGLRERLIEALETLAETYRDQGLSASIRLEEAPAIATEIARVAEEEHVDWIVLSTHGRTGLSHLALGSVAERVVRTASCPTLTVKQTKA